MELVRKHTPNACLLLLLIPCSLPARPMITANGIVSAASFKPAGSPGGAIAPGSVFSIFGAGLGPSDGVMADTFPLETELAGVSIRVTGGNNAAVDALPVYVSDTQINAILPSNAPLGQVSLTVSYQDETSDASTVQVVASSFGIITQASNGIGPAAVQNAASPTDQSLNTLSNAARPGQIVVLYGTGLGAINAPDNMPPPPGDLNLPIEILVAGRPARKIYAGRSPCCPGLDQVNFEIPAGTPNGCYVPVTVKAGNSYSNYATLSVTSGGGACLDPINPLAAATGGSGTQTVGKIGLNRTLLQLTANGQNIDSTLDSASAAFLQVNENFFNPQFALPPPGSCSVYAFPASGDKPVDFLAPPSSLRDAGSSFELTGLNSVKSVSQQSAGNYFATLGGGVALPGQHPAPLFFAQGPYTLTSAGGADIGALSATLKLPDPSTWTLNWTNRQQITAIDRTQPLRVTWNVADPSQGVALISGSSTDVNLMAGGHFICVAPLGPGQFDVPASVLGSLPASVTLSGVPSGTLQVGTLVYVSSFTAPGLDVGVVSYGSTVSRLVSYR